MAAMLLIALWVINLMYGFEGSFERLGDYHFFSLTLGGHKPQEQERGARVGNRFSRAWLGRLPVAVPENYLRGIDAIKSEYEGTYWSYLNGQWRSGGWWYYYLYAMLIKEPLATWVLGAVAVAVACWYRRLYTAPPREEALLLAPAFAVLALVSSQTGFNHHLRYVLPAFPFLFILISRVGRSFELRHRKLAVLVSVALGWSVVSSLRVAPHSLSYFNELGGGPMGGHYHLGASNTDWGQDLLYLGRWYNQHPTARPLHVAYDLPLIDPRLAGIECTEIPVGPHSVNAPGLLAADLGPQPGWYAVSVNKIHNLERDFDYFLDFTPVGYAGYSIYIYHITPEAVDRVRRKLGQPALGSHSP